MASAAAGLRRAFVTASAVWAAALPLAAAGSSLASPAGPVYVFTASVFAIGAAVCHQLPERSFHLWGRQLPVCARCAGIYVSAALVGISWLLRVRGGRIGASPETRPLRVWMGAFALGLNALTLVYEWTTGVVPPNAVRFAAGATLGAVVAAFIVYDVD